MVGFIPELISHIIVAIIVALFTVNLSLHKFVHNKWWEKREQAYSEIIGILTTLQYSLEELRDDLASHMIEENGYTVNERANLYTRVRTENAKLKKLTAEGSFRLSNNSILSLKKLIKNLSYEGDSEMDVLNLYIDSVRESINIVKEEAYSDLNLRSKWLFVNNRK